jgi:hypothetical protein
MPLADQAFLARPADRSPCGCLEENMAHNTHSQSSDDIPRLEELDTLLDEAASEENLEAGDFELDQLETALAAEEELLLVDESDDSPLGRLLELASRYPGLKITLSF